MARLNITDVSIPTRFFHLPLKVRPKDYNSGGAVTFEVKSIIFNRVGLNFKSKDKRVHDSTSLEL